MVSSSWRSVFFGLEGFERVSQTCSDLQRTCCQSFKPSLSRNRRKSRVKKVLFQGFVVSWLVSGLIQRLAKAISIIQAIISLLGSVMMQLPAIGLAPSRLSEDSLRVLMITSLNRRSAG